MLNFAFCFFFTNCNQTIKKNEVEYDGVREIDIMANISTTQKVNLSTIASNIYYCMLETDRKCLVANMAIYCSKDFVVTIGDNCYVFDRKTGNFIRQISRKGQGPGDYTETISSFWDEYNEQICLYGNMQFLFYNLDGTLSHKANRFTHKINQFVSFEHFFVGYVPNLLGNAKIRIAYYDKTGAIVDSIPNYRSWKRTRPSYGGSLDGWLYISQDSLYYKDIYCDTLYYVDGITLQPRYIFNTNNQAPPYEMQEGGRYDILAASRNGGIFVDRYEKYFCIFYILEGKENIYFPIEYRQKLYPSVYNKIENKLQIMPPVPIPPKKGIHTERIKRFGFNNDLDGGLPFWPQQMISDKEMMCVYTAEELLELDSSKITDEKLKNILKNLKEDDNPVVAIVALKD